ncbi:hypothetical protein SNK04_013083 [Fusarium graminearum]
MISKTSPLYEPLNEATDEIRLLTLLPKSRSTGIPHCTLGTYSLRAFTPQHKTFLFSTVTVNSSLRSTTSEWKQSRLEPELAGLAPLKRLHSKHPPPSHYRFTWGDYAALSYVWGDEKDTTIIAINNKRRRVTTNLAKALSAFVQDGEFEDGYKLWVDAICINQQDMDERARQLRKMRHIYGDAWSVVAWLGEPSFQSDSAIQLIRDFADLSKTNSGSQIESCLRREPEFLGKGCWLALHDLMERPYWSRLWIIQEMIMGASATWIRCGSASIDWVSFCSGLAFLEENLWLVKDELLVRERLAVTKKNGPAWSVMGIHLVYQDLSILSEREEKGGQYPSFGRLLDIANDAECSNPRDKVYGLVGMMSIPVSSSLRPDYTLPVNQVYAATARTFIEVDGNLEPIRDGNLWGPSKGPSWAADWLWEGRIRSSRAENQLWGPTRLFPRLGPEALLQTPYNASGDTRHDAAFSIDGSILTCSGFIVDSISGLSARGTGYFDLDKTSIVQPHRWNSAYGDRSATSEALYCTLVMDRISGVQEPLLDMLPYSIYLVRLNKANKNSRRGDGVGWLGNQITTSVGKVSTR